MRENGHLLLMYHDVSKISSLEMCKNECLMELPWMVAMDATTSSPLGLIFIVRAPSLRLARKNSMLPSDPKCFWIPYALLGPNVGAQDPILPTFALRIEAER